MFISTDLLIVFFAAIPIGIIAIVLGGTMFLSLPLFQLLYPTLTMGAIVGNIKVGSVFRNITAVIPLWKEIHLKDLLIPAIPLILGSICGALGIAYLSQKFILPALLIAILLTEFASKISKYITPKIYFIVALAAGIFGGILGAGISLIIISLVRIRIHDDNKIFQVRAHGILLELLSTVAAVVVFAFSGVLITSLWIAWTLGAIIGGYIGGYIIKYTGKCSPLLQKWLMRLMFVVAIAIAGYKFIS